MNTKIEITDDLLELYVCDLANDEEIAAVEAAMDENEEIADKVLKMSYTLFATKKSLEKAAQSKQQNGNTNPFISDSAEEYEDAEMSMANAYVHPRRAAYRAAYAEYEYNEMSMAAFKDKNPMTKLWKSIKRHWKIIVGFTVAILMVVAGIIIGIKVGSSQAKDETKTSERVEYGEYHANIPTEWQWTEDGFLNINWTVTNPEKSAPMQEIHYKLKTNGTFGGEKVETASGNGYAFKAEELENVEEIELFLRVGYHKEYYETAFGPVTIKITR